MSDPISIPVGKGEADVRLLAKFSNRHGIIAGATGTGKTVTLQTLAEGFSSIGVPVFAADIKGDLSGISQKGGGNPKIEARVQQMGLTDYVAQGVPTVFWDLFGEQGHPIRTTISDMGPLLISRMLDLNEVQEGVLNVAFRIADEQGLLLLDLNDLRAILAHVAENADELRRLYGNVSDATVGTIQRSLLVLEEQGGTKFFGEPALDLNDFFRTTPDGKGLVHVLAANRLMQNPRLYSTFLLWLLAELFEDMPEVGDLDKPRLVFFFDEAHLLFDDAPKALLDKVEQVVRLIRSKGIGVYFCTQNPADVPEDVLAQLGNRFQHALRAYTPREQKGIRAASDSFRVNPKFKTDEVLQQLIVGEALVSVLGSDGAPSVVDRVLIRPPGSRLGPVTPEERKNILFSDAVGPKYDQTSDRESAFEMLAKRTQETLPASPPPPESRPQFDYRLPEPTVPRRQPAPEYREPAPRREPARRSDTVIESIVKSAARSASSSLGREIMRGIFGSILRGGRKR
jgi:DNA helicase HerA-like ATPase